MSFLFGLIENFAKIHHGLPTTRQAQWDWLWSACSRQQNSVFSVMVTRTLHDLVVPHAQRISSFEASCMVNLSERITEGAQQFGVQYVCHTEAERTFVRIAPLFSLSVSCFCGMVIVGIHRVLGNRFVVDRD